MSASMVKDELRELTNRINHWRALLLRWHAWNLVVASYSELEAWDLQTEFVESTAHFCLLYPSSFRDTLTFVATNVLHQLKLSIEKGYIDKLEGDPDPRTMREKHLSRKKKEERLRNLVTQWNEGEDLCKFIATLDDRSYRSATADYRNRFSHAIAPRLALGETQSVTRRIEQATRLEIQPDGTMDFVPVPGMTTVSYAYGAIQPLDMEEARLRNLDQYRRGLRCYAAFRQLLSIGMSNLPKT